MSRDTRRGGITAAEAVVTLLLGALLVGLGMGLLAHGGRRAAAIATHGCRVIDDAIVRTALDRDSWSVPCGLSPAVAPDRLRLPVAGSFRGDGGVAVQDVEYTLCQAGRAVAVTRNGRRIAGPFDAGRFEETVRPGGVRGVRLVLSNRPTRGRPARPVVVEMWWPPCHHPQGVGVIASR